MFYSKNVLMQEFITYIHNIYKYNIDILLEGATGTGKDFWAEYIHEKTKTKGHFIPINCAAIPENLAESELFGCEAGAYTGARKRIGKVEWANNGTLYLDEIDSMPLILQTKLLRVLQNKGCERIGSNTFIPSNFRLIASTKVNLKQLIDKQLFREDLYYRINTIHLTIPILQKRKEDIIDLFDEYIKEAQIKFKLKNINTVSDELSKLLINHTWPGNIRELICVAQRYVLEMPLQITYSTS